MNSKSFWRGKLCLCRLPSDNMKSLKFIRVLEVRGHITKNHLLRTMLLVRANGRVQQSRQVIGHV